MDSALIYAISENDLKFYASHQMDQSAARQSAWLIYGSNISQEFKNKLKTMKIEPSAAWTVNEYHVLLILNDFVQHVDELCQQYQVDFAFLQGLPNINKPGLALFDMDSTAIEIECIDQIAKLAGVGKEIAKITERAMRGELDFAKSLTERVAKLKGVNTELLSQINLPLTSGMQKLCATLQQYGWKVAIASGGFTFFSDQLKQTLPLCYATANQLEVEDGKLTGNLVGNIVDAQRKAEILYELAKRYHLPLSQTIAVGDGANDLPMMSAAALGFAYKAKPKVQEKAQITIRHADLGGVICVLSASLFLFPLLL